MRFLLASLLMGFASLSAAQDGDKLTRRFGIDVNLDRYPQKTPKESLQSVVKAIANKKGEYLVAHLADPAFVDRQIASYKAGILNGADDVKQNLAFDRLVKETDEHFLNDPSVFTELRKFAQEAEWEVKDNTAVGTVKSIFGRKVFMKKVEERWFLEDKQQ